MLKDYKIFVANEEESRKVQEHAFKLGCKWVYNGQKVQHLDQRFLFVNTSRIAHCDNDYEYFRIQSDEFISVYDFLRIPPKKEVKLKEIYKIHSECGNSLPPLFNSYKEAQDYIKKVLIQGYPNKTYSIKKYYTGKEV